MRNIFRNNLPEKALAIGAALALWLNFAAQTDLAGMLAAPLQFRHYPGDLEISSTVTESIQAEVRGSAGQLRDLTGKVSAVIDLASVTAPGERTFTIHARDLNLPSGITLVRTVPAQVRLTFEKRASRFLKVEIPFSGQLKPGVTIDRLDVEPPLLEIIGPESKVNAARNPMSDPLDLRAVEDGSEHRLAVYIAEPEVRFVAVPSVKVKVHASPPR
jgi:YbbR domain-containing protein